MEEGIARVLLRRNQFRIFILHVHILSRTHDNDSQCKSIPPIAWSNSLEYSLAIGEVPPESNSLWVTKRLGVMGYYLVHRRVVPGSLSSGFNVYNGKGVAFKSGPHNPKKNALGIMITVMGTSSGFEKSSLKSSKSLRVISSNQQSAIHKKMAPRIAFWVNRHVSPRFTVIVWESDRK